jgi:hypothetical protein
VTYSAASRSFPLAHTNTPTLRDRRPISLAGTGLHRFSHGTETDYPYPVRHLSATETDRVVFSQLASRDARHVTVSRRLRVAGFPLAPGLWFRGVPRPTDATLTYRTRLLLVLPHPLARRRNTPVLLFSRSYRYSPILIDLIGVDARILSRFLGPLPLNLHTSIWSRPHTRALLLPSFVNSLATGSRDAVPTSHACPFFGPGLPPIRFLGRSALLPPAECHELPPDLV